MTRPQISRAIFGMILVSGMLLFFTACRTTRSLTSAVVAPSKDHSAANLSQVELHEKLAAFYVQFINTIEAATVNAAARTDDLEFRQRLVRSRIRVVHSCQQAIFQRNPLAAFVDTWSLCLQIETAMDSPEEKALMGETRPLFMQAARDLNSNIEELGSLFLKPEQLAETKARLEAFARTHPFSPQNEVVFPSDDAGTGIPQLGWLLELPLSPFRAFQGVDQTAAAVHELSLIASGFAQTASDMPRELSWQAELLLLQTRQETEAMFLELDQRQTNTQATMQQAQLALAETSRVMAQLNASLVSSKDTASAISEAATGLNQLTRGTADMMKEIHDLYPPAPVTAASVSAPPGRPFDILDYARTAQQIAGAASNLTQVLVEVQKTVGSDTLMERMDEADTRARNLSDHIALLIVAVTVVFFGCWFGFRMALVHWPPKTQPLSKPGGDDPAS